MSIQANVWTLMSVKLFQDFAWVVLVPIQLVALHVSVLKGKVWMKITFVKMKMNVQLSMVDKRFVRMDNVSIEILDTFAFVILDTYPLKIRKPVWMPDKGTVTTPMIAEIHFLTNYQEWTVVVTLDNPGANLVCHVKVVLPEGPKNDWTCAKA